MTTATTPKAAEQVRLDLQGMTCASCASRIERGLNALEGVAATVNYATEEAAVAYDARSVTIDELVAAVEAAGYHASRAGDATTGDALGDLRRRLAVALALSIPVTLLAMIPQLQFGGWEWLAFACATPVVLWAGSIFHRAARRSPASSPRSPCRSCRAGPW